MQAPDMLNSKLGPESEWRGAAAPAHGAAEPRAAATVFYMCRRCFEAADVPSPCPRCGGERAVCRPGALDDPARRPPVTPGGEIRNRAPLWWLRASAAVAHH